MFLRNMSSPCKTKNMFQFLVMVEVFYKQGDLIYLLDYVQKTREGRNVGFISIYGEITVHVHVQEMKGETK